MKVVALAGGVGGAKLAQGLSTQLNPSELTVVVNTGDDFEHLGLYIAPDLDTVCYTLAGLANTTTGWGLENDTWTAYQELGSLGAPTWFQIGDRDLATHLMRTALLRHGSSLTEITSQLCTAWKLQVAVLPMCDKPAPTYLETIEGRMAFQEYFVHRRCLPRITSINLEAAKRAAPNPRVLDALMASDLVIVCPSNPFVSIGPILAVPGYRDAITGKRVLAVSPIVAGKAIKGPAAKMLIELNMTPSASAVAVQYLPWCTDFVMDSLDAEQQSSVQALGLRTLITNTVMTNPADRGRLARELLEFAKGSQA